ncbi:MAG: hypothetical protein Q6L49_11855, partial [Thermostichales cyanobacterium HHBFW_bins_127]
RTEIAEVRGQVKQVEERLSGEIKRLDTELKSVETTLAAKLDGLTKRVDSQEFVNRGVIVALAGGLLTGLVKLLFFPDRLS